MKDFINIFSKVPHDKLAHFFSGSVLFVLLNFFFIDLTSAVLVLIAAVSKELVWDGIMKQGTVDVVDALFTFMPVIFYFVV
jgi:ABC-type bacteriocin/lantibiotic exporter with double-glycine peptidase domain